jgi:cold shock CspA family protein
MIKGKVKKYNADHGESVIVDKKTGQKLRVYANFVRRKQKEFLREGQDVEYE